MSLDEFREMTWAYDAEKESWHMFQQMVVFGHMLDDLLTQWVGYGATLEGEASRPPEGLKEIRGRHGWQEYAEKVADSDDLDWREFVQVAGLMQNRIHHMMHKAAAYHE